MQSLTRFFVALVQKYLPDPFLFAAILTFVVYVGGLLLTDNGPYQMVQHWGNGFWNLLTFSMQMVLVLVTGHALAESPPIKKILRAIASLVTSPGGAIMMTCFVAAIASWINWGFGLVVGALLGREMARRVKGLDYRLIIACAYMGFLVWHAGLAGSIPLALNTPTDWSFQITNGIPVSQTIFAPFNLITAIFLILTLPILARLMMSKDAVEVDPALLAEPDTVVPPAKTPAEKIENSPVVSVLLAAGAAAFLIFHFGKGGSLNLNIVNFLFLFSGILLHGTPRRYITALYSAAKGSAGIILQFPFYAGIMGMMVSSGLAVIISQWFVNISTPFTFPFFAFLSAGVVNVFVPSGGGQWAVQGPIILPASAALGVDTARAAMAIAWGDAWTNMIQPFWALPALGIAGLNARDIMGYCLMALLYSGIIITIGLLFL
ncbi:MAG: short-chain fatty acid transporter [Deferrisomatales bacterium]|nr:short-chain fatty acid transporter [Deferrisomatales bacterium]